jgi:hypothetical protein
VQSAGALKWFPPAAVCNAKRILFCNVRRFHLVEALEPSVSISCWFGLPKSRFHVVRRFCETACKLVSFLHAKLTFEAPVLQPDFMTDFRPPRAGTAAKVRFFMAKLLLDRIIEK